MLKMLQMYYSIIIRRVGKIKYIHICKHVYHNPVYCLSRPADLLCEPAEIRRRRRFKQTGIKRTFSDKGDGRDGFGLDLTNLVPAGQ